MTENTCESAQQKTKSIDWFSTLLIFVVVVSVIVAVAFYRVSFDAGLSQAPDRWSAFGSYIGGVFGPLISFLTLLAILKTIGLQKELLNTQRTEFEAMQALQVKAIEAQLSQIRSSEAEVARRLIEESRINSLQALDKYMHGVRSEYSYKKNNLDSMYKMAMEGKSGVSADNMARMAEKLKEYESKLASMTVLYGEICFEEFENVVSLRKVFQEGLSKIWHPSEKKAEKSDAQ
ncbi:hypothetical protein HMH05_24195 [Pseudomonas sp. SbB1]|uniref:Uncharacterized protein n=1 Tax=Pseudomonas putida (strain GB-1) TaxID=76869 RepID=B0KHB4_PSEPG|nr:MULTISPECIES: hypothetical protein [Pseudomonas]ABY97619.1 hypothetical protein PputGB1_1716 [Pseudomonas putida GB-1]MBP0711433.1 hypothetical protein [Pseudomonas sp. T34]MCK2190887.1 hypothetical protein [Pseudomonas sp. MB04B]MDD2088382.1 hypothetical protein [Pseudomonas putida]MDD2098296.1 hypothetical protein [Pseudomonas putida]